MKFDESNPGERPDPRRGIEEVRSRFPVPVASLVAQPALEIAHAVINSASHNASLEEMSAIVTYTLWRNPDDRTDPVNLAATDVASNPFGTEYPLLYEAVRTTWISDESNGTPVDSLLAHHVQHILRNQFGVLRPTDDAELDAALPHEIVAADLVQPRDALMVDGEESPAYEIESFPQVYGVGALLPSGGVVTAVVPRSEIDHVNIAFSTQ